MEKLKKRHNPLLLELSFNAIRQFRTTAIVYLGMCVLHLLLLALAIFQIVNPTATAAIMQGFPFVLVFTILAGGYLCFLLFGVLAHGKGVLLNLWGHLLLFFDGCSGLLIELSMKCYANVQMRANIGRMVPKRNQVAGVCGGCCRYSPASVHGATSLLLLPLPRCRTLPINGCWTRNSSAVLLQSCCLIAG